MTEIEAPRAIGRYDVERLLGQGGMGRVWLAKDTVLGRRVAIKVLRDDLALPGSVRDELALRMRHEARAAAAVSHPNIVTLHDMGEDPDVGLFLVFEYVPGPRVLASGTPAPESLRDRLARGRLPLTEVGILARDLGSALSFAHEAGVIHRDIKPENVLFSRTGAKIADFGIARIPDSTITRANTVLGTPAYTAPEALADGAFGPASDQFSLAATLYEAATGKRAFGGDDPLEAAGKVTNATPAPIDPTIASPALLSALERALLRGLAKDPRERFASAAELGDAVARAIERAPASDAPPPPEVSSVDLIEIERTPLSSRIALERARMASDRPSGNLLGETPTARPSVLLRKKTQRAQNIVAAIALLVIVVLVLLGRRKPAEDPAARDAKSAEAATTTRPAPPHPRATPHAVTTVRAVATSHVPAPEPVIERAADAGVERRVPSTRDE